MIEFRRQALQEAGPQADTHAGLWLDKYLKDDSDDAKKDLVKAIAQTIHLPVPYKPFYNRWKLLLEQGGAVCREAKTLGRLAINLGSETTLETSIALHHTYGTPYIPGSALKGLASHYALNYLDAKNWGRDTQAFRNIFGDMTSAGYVNFFDALYVPGKGQPLWPDVITVHHPDYYQTGQTPPADWDNPIPIPFLTASGSFLIALSGPADWVNAAYDILGYALESEGIGAKTSSGYGRMRFESAETANETITEKKTAVPQEIPAGYQRGVVKTVKDTFGFIQPDAGGEEIFVHVSDLESGIKELKPGLQVIYKPGPGKKKGQMQAFDVSLAE
jgi:CRISPR-associated protein Cmr6